MSRPRRTHADLDWLMSRPVRRGQCSHQPKNWCKLPDLKGREVVALAMRAHGHGQKSISAKLNLTQFAVRNFLIRLGIGTTVDSKHSPGVADHLGRIRQRKIERTRKQAFARKAEVIGRSVAKRYIRDISPGGEMFIGPCMPKYYRDIKASREYSKKQAKKRYYSNKNSPAFRIKKYVAQRIRKALRLQHTNKSASTLQLIGCEIDQLRSHLERRFTDGMSWTNYGDKWHIDHIVPLAAFDLTDPREQRRAFHYTNLQPLWAADNIRKSSRLYPGGPILRHRTPLPGTRKLLDTLR